MGIYETWRNWAEESKQLQKKLMVVMENGQRIQGIATTTDSNTITMVDSEGEISIAFAKIMYIRKCVGEKDDTALFNTPTKRRSEK